LKQPQWVTHGLLREPSAAGEGIVQEEFDFVT